jgi:histidine ammonia-lyase
MCQPGESGGLPTNLVGDVEERSTHHGFKAMSIGASALTAEALKLTMPASVFSRSTECHNQDKVSMGTIAARDCLRVLQLTEQVAAAHTLAAVQALRLRGSAIVDGAIRIEDLDRDVRAFSDSVSSSFRFLEDDRAVDADLRSFVGKIQGREWPLYEA